MTKISETPSVGPLGLADLMFIAQNGDVVEHATLEQFLAFIRAVGDKLTAPPIGDDFLIQDASNGDGNVTTLLQNPGALLMRTHGISHALATAHSATKLAPQQAQWSASARLRSGMPDVNFTHFGLMILDVTQHKMIVVGHTGGVGIEFNHWTLDYGAASPSAFVTNIWKETHDARNDFTFRFTRNADGTFTLFKSNSDNGAYYPVAANDTYLQNSAMADLRVGFITLDEYHVPNMGTAIPDMYGSIYFYEDDSYPRKNFLFDPASINYPNIPFVYNIVPVTDSGLHALTKGDAGKFFDCKSNAGFTFNDEGVGSPTGATVVFRQSAGFVVSLAAAGAVTIRTPAGRKASTTNQGDVLVAVKTGAQEWTVYGDTAVGQGNPTATVWGIRLQTADNPNYCSLFEIEFRKAVGVPETATGGTAHCDRSYFGMADVNYLFDGNKAGGQRFASGQPYAGNKIWYQFPDARQINEVAVYPYDSGGEHPTGFDVIYSTDGGNTFITLNQVRGLNPGNSPQGTPILVAVAVPPPVVVPPTATVVTDPGDSISPLIGDRWIIGNGAHAYQLQSPGEAVPGTDDATGIGCTVTFIQNSGDQSSFNWSAGDSVSCIRPVGRGVSNLGGGSVVVARYIGVRRWSITGDLGT